LVPEFIPFYYSSALNKLRNTSNISLALRVYPRWYMRVYCSLCSYYSLYPFHPRLTSERVKQYDIIVSDHVTCMDIPYFLRFARRPIPTFFRDGKFGLDNYRW